MSSPGAPAIRALEVVLNDPVRSSYTKLVVSDDGRTLLGGVLVGDATGYDTLRTMVGVPRHAELRVSDVDTESLVRYVDRFLMFYIRTADRLQRTASWIEAMDGGLDHLRGVVVADGLGIADELEAAMGEHVANYADEWAGILEDPEKLARFTSFVNAPDAPDPTIEFVDRRGSGCPPIMTGEPTRVDQQTDLGGGRTMRFVDVDATKPEAGWATVCAVHDLLVERGVTALIGGAPVAVFCTYDGGLYALHNVDPFSGASVLSRGIVGDRDGVPTVASPVYKQVFGLRTGTCLDDPAVSVPTFPVRLRDGMVELGEMRGQRSATRSVPA